MGKMPVTYASYLKIDDLLKCQVPLSEGPEHDEMLFIVIHQVYELWFRSITHELEYLQKNFDRDDVPTSYATLKRVLTILKVLVSQIDVLETMSPLSFKSFRSRLESSSGFQSLQFRELEIVLGKRGQDALNIHQDNPEGLEKLRARLKEPSVYDSFIRFLGRRRGGIPEEVLSRDLSQTWTESPAVEEVITKTYQQDPEAAQICERMVDLDEGLQEWRYRHVKMVERTIGTKAGTGGSSGAEYLRTTLFQSLFPELWSARTAF
ncbi:MAG: tryptophan 2,3-dioxygenase [Fimbriimonadaceae bacterium]|jgi:tryptophan 2,3-dioxygenase|nr:tryptophan 2,3-dioxygenase [Fimbriimonadaceae bacterium]